MEEFERGKGNHAMLTGREALGGRVGMRIQVSSPLSSTMSHRSLPPYWLSWQSRAWKMLFGGDDDDDGEVNGAVAAGSLPEQSYTLHRCVSSFPQDRKLNT